MSDHSTSSAGAGAVIAFIISYLKWHSIGWALLHALLGWLYIVWYVIRYLL